MQQQRRHAYTFLKPLLLSSALGSLGVFSVLFTLALSLVEYLIHPRRQTLFDRHLKRHQLSSAA